MKKVLLKLLVPSVRRLLAPVRRLAWLDRHTDTHTQDKYRNPRCACAPRVNYRPKCYPSLSTSFSGSFVWSKCSTAVLTGGNPLIKVFSLISIWTERLSLQREHLGNKRTLSRLLHSQGVGKMKRVLVWGEGNDELVMS